MLRDIRKRREFRAVTLLETIVVLLIIGILLAFLFPAVQRARNAARNSVCKNNLHQLVIALSHYQATKKKLPDPATPNTVSGWAVAVLPFLEEQVLADELAGGPNISQPSISKQISHRPLIMTCPFGWEGDSSVAGVPTSHYVLLIGPERSWFEIGDVPLNFRLPWVQSPELDLLSLPRDEGPHDGGYYIAQYGETSLSGDVSWFAGK
jgi:type II secretory pathway pseudopilin PulG